MPIGGGTDQMAIDADEWASAIRAQVGPVCNALSDYGSGRGTAFPCHVMCGSPSNDGMGLEGGVADPNRGGCAIMGGGVQDHSHPA